VLWYLGPGLSILLMAEGPAPYKPRHPERTAFYQILDEYFEPYVRVHEERFEKSSGPLRPVVRGTVEAFLDCGLLHNGFARLRCGSCGAEHLLALACEAYCISPNVAKLSPVFGWWFRAGRRILNSGS
jgi:hypothetical protein